MDTTCRAAPLPIKDDNRGAATNRERAIVTEQPDPQSNRNSSRVRSVTQGLRLQERLLKESLQMLEPNCYGPKTAPWDV
eukprot:2411839-Pyramimonas_sp.AAC.1